MQIKTTMGYNFTPIRMPGTKKTENDECSQGLEETRTLINCWWEYKMLQSLWKKAWQFLIPMRNEGICPHKNLHTNVLSSLIHNSQKAETTQMSINKWKDKQNVVYPYNWVLFGHKKEWSANTCYNLEESLVFHAMAKAFWNTYQLALSVFHLGFGRGISAGPASMRVVTVL